MNPGDAFLYVMLSIVVAGGWVAVGYGGRKAWDAIRQGRRR